MIELETIRFVSYDKESKMLFVMLLTDENESLPLNILVGIPEIMTKEIIDEIILVNKTVDDETEENIIDIQKIDQKKMSNFFGAIISNLVNGEEDTNLEVSISP